MQRRVQRHRNDEAAIVFEEYLLRRAARDRHEAEQRLSEAIAVAVDAGLELDAIGRILGVGTTGGGQHLDQAS